MIPEDVNLTYTYSLYPPGLYFLQRLWRFHGNEEIFTAPEYATII